MEVPNDAIPESTDDVCVYADIKSSLAFTLNGDPVYVISDDEPDPERTFTDLRQKVFVTHWIEDFAEMPSGYYRCVFRGSDRSVHVMFFTADAITHNRQVIDETFRPERLRLPVFPFL